MSKIPGGGPEMVLVCVLHKKNHGERIRPDGPLLRGYDSERLRGGLFCSSRVETVSAAFDDLA